MTQEDEEIVREMLHENASGLIENLQIELRDEIRRLEIDIENLRTQLEDSK